MGPIEATIRSEVAAMTGDKPAYFDTRAEIAYKLAANLDEGKRGSCATVANELNATLGLMAGMEEGHDTDAFAGLSTPVHRPT